MTLKDIAKRCEVSRITVSYALRGDRTNVGEATMKRIVDTARQMGYDGSMAAAARRLRYSRSGRHVINHLAGLFFPFGEIRRTYWITILDGLQRTLLAAGYGILSCAVDVLKGSVAEQLPYVFRRGEVDGALVVPTEQYRENLVGALRDEFGFGGRPIVTIGERLPGCSTVVFDERHVGATAAGHLLDLGHRRILQFRSPRYASPIVLQRIEGVRQAFRERGLDPDEGLHSEGWIWEDPAGLREAAKEVLKKYPSVTGILAPNDRCGVELADVLVRLGYGIPGDISIVGVDDIAGWPQGEENRWTTVRLPLAELGATAAQLLLDHVTGDKQNPETKTLHGTLIVRGTTSRI